jgi:heat shock protein HslJ
MQPALPLLAALLAAAVVGGCGGDEEESAADPSSLEGVPWVLVSGVDVDGWETVAPSLTFEGGQVSGSSGCNQFGGSYTVDGSSLELGEIAMTAMGCPPPADEVEQTSMDALQGTAGWRLEGEELVLVDADDAELLRYRPASPEGSWVATGLLQGDAFTSLLEGTEITATFDDEGALSGSAGCNNYNASYTTDGSAIEIDAPSSTKMACPEPEGVMDQEAAYLAALPNAAAYRVSGSLLELLSAEGTAVVTYTRGESR